MSATTARKRRSRTCLTDIMSAMHGWRDPVQNSSQPAQAPEANNTEPRSTLPIIPADNWVVLSHWLKHTGRKLSCTRRSYLIGLPGDL